MPVQPEKIAELDFDATLGLSRDDVTDKNNIRRYLHRKGITLPGDIDLFVQETAVGAFHVTVWENPILKEDSQ